MDQDEQYYLKLLAIFHYILAGIIGFISCLPIFHVIIGLLIVFGCLQLQDGAEKSPSPFIGLIFLIPALLFIVSGWAAAVCIFLAGRKISKRKSWLYCMVLAGFECFFMPLGTVLGVFTIILLAKESVKKLFMDSQSATPTENNTNLS